MSALDQVLTIGIVKLEHPNLHKEAAAELAALRDAKLIATHLLIDIQTFFNSEVKACGGVGCEFELGMLDSISAFLDLHGTEGNIKGNE